MVSDEQDIVDIPSEEPSQMDSYEEPKRKVRIGTYWKKPPTLTYQSNFGFGVNAYQPMIDYLDAKDSGMTYNKKDIYLPNLDERAMDQYSATKPYRNYSNMDINNYIEKGDGIVRQIRQNDALEAGGSCLNRTHTNWSMTKKWVQLVKQSNVIDYRKLREERKAEEEQYIPLRSRANRRRALASQNRSRTPSLTRTSRAHSRGSSAVGTSTRASVATQKSDTIDKMVQTYEDAISTLAHSKMDHEMLMASRRERLSDLDTQFEDVITNLADSLSRLNRQSRALQTPSTSRDETVTRQDVVDDAEEQLLKRKIRRQQEFAALNDEVNEVMNSQRSQRTTRAINDMDYEVSDMNDRLDDLSYRQRSERQADLDALTALTQAAAAYAASKRLSRTMDLNDVQDEDIDYLKKRGQGVRQKIVVEKPKPRRKYDPNSARLSDVQARVVNKASEMSNSSSSIRRIQNRARYVNIYAPKPETADPDMVVKPSRTELNIDNMAKSFVERGKMTRRYAIDEEVDPPASNLNTNAINYYRNRDVQRTIADVPSNSLRVRYAVIRARCRNTILGY